MLFGIHGIIKEHKCGNKYWNIGRNNKRGDDGIFIQSVLQNETAGVFRVFRQAAITLAIYHTAKAENRAKVAGALASMAFTSFLTGITEPIEFSFMFLAPILYVIHAILTGISMIVCYEAGVLVGFGFGPCFIDYVLNYGISTRPELIIPVGLGIGAIYYAIFRYAIVKLNLATLGREEENSAEKISDSGDLADKMIKGRGGRHKGLNVRRRRRTC